MKKLYIKFKEELKEGCRIICQESKLPGWEDHLVKELKRATWQGSIYLHQV